MDKTKETITIMQRLIIEGNLSKIKELVNEGINVHYENDYFLYLSVLSHNKKLQKYFIYLGLEPEAVKEKIGIVLTKELEYLITLKKEKTAIEFAEKLDDSLLNKTNIKVTTIKRKI